MSTLSKVFVILVFLIACVWTGVVATLFAHRVDWKDKYLKEVGYHQLTMNTKNAEIANVQLELANVNEHVAILQTKNNQITSELASSNAKLLEVQRQLDFTKGLMTNQQASLDVFTRQLEVQLKSIESYSNRLEDFRKKLTVAMNEKFTANQQLAYERQMAERLGKDMADLEKFHVDLARSHKHLEEKLGDLASRGINVDATPRKALTGRVMAVDNSLGIVILSIGKADEVLANDTFTIYRGGVVGGEFVAKIVIDKVDQNWASGRIQLRRSDPRVGDEASNHILVPGANPGAGGK